MISASIVLYFRNSPSVGNKKYQIVRELIYSLAANSLVKTVVLIDNSPIQGFQCLAEISKKIVYIWLHGANLGYGKSHNLARYIGHESKYHLIVNPDIILYEGLLESLVYILEANKDLSMIQPDVVNPDDLTSQYLCKRNPTLLAMIIRMMPVLQSIEALRRYNLRYECRDTAYKDEYVESSYLSGCFMLCRRQDLDRVNWFSTEYFMYLEDADISRKLKEAGRRCLHVPSLSVGHVWAKESHKNLRLRLTAIWSFCIYSWKWGLELM